MTAAPPTHDTPPTWDLSEFFDAFDSASYRAFTEALFADLEAQLDRTKALDGIQDDAGRRAWAACFAHQEALLGRLTHVFAYMGGLTSTHTTNEVYQSARANLAARMSAYEKSHALLMKALRGASDADFDALLTCAELDGAAFAARRLREAATKLLDGDMELLVADLNVTGSSAWGTLYSRVMGQLTFTLDMPGRDPEQVPFALKRSLTQSPDPAVRKAALEGSNAAIQERKEVYTSALNAIAGTRLTLYRWRGVEHFLDEAVFTSAITRETLDAMMEAVRQMQPLAQEYLHHKAGLMGVERLGFQDISAPLPLPDRPPVGWSVARSQIEEAFERWHGELGGFARHAFDGGWIEAEPRAGKAPGGYCTSSHLLGQSRIFMTYNATLGDVQTLAHELGHAFHNWAMRDMRSFARRYPMTLAETASTFAETVLSDALLTDPASSDADRLEILDTRLGRAEAFLLNIPMRFDFECDVYTERAKGELSASRLQELMLKAQDRNYGDTIDPDARDPWFWASKQHFYFAGRSFYNYPYTFGYLFSLSVFLRAKQAGAEAFYATYRELLRATGSGTAEEVARNVLGADLTDPEFWLAPSSLIRDDLKRYAELGPKLLGA